MFFQKSFSRTELIFSCICVFQGNVNPLYCHPSYCPSTILHIRPTATSDLRQLFIFGLFDGYVTTIPDRALWLGWARRLSAAARTWARGPGATVRSPSSSCKTTCQQVGWSVGRMGVGPKIHHCISGVETVVVLPGQTKLVMTIATPDIFLFLRCLHFSFYTTLIHFQQQNMNIKQII